MWWELCLPRAASGELHPQILKLNACLDSISNVHFAGGKFGPPPKDRFGPSIGRRIEGPAKLRFGATPSRIKRASRKAESRTGRSPAERGCKPFAHTGLAAWPAAAGIPGLSAASAISPESVQAKRIARRNRPAINNRYCGCERFPPGEEAARTTLPAHKFPPHRPLTNALGCCQPRGCATGLMPRKARTASLRGAPRENVAPT